MKIRVNPHNLEIIREETEPINELEVKVSKCEFEFDEKITNEFVKEAYFTLNGSTYKQIIVNNECDYPNEVLTEKGTLEIGVVAYKVENGEELIRYNPSPDYYDTWEGSLKDAENSEPITPSDKEQMQSQISQNTSDISDLQANKQDKLTAGDNITIDENNVISAVDTIYDDTEIKADIQELQETKIDKDVNNLTYYTLTTETGSKITLSIDSSTYVMTLKLKDKNNNDISTANVDLPLETMVVGARYDSATKEIVLTLKNGQEVRFSVADLVSGLQTEITENNKLSSDLVDDTNNTNKFVSAEEKEQITTNKNDITAIKDGQNIDSFADVETALNLKEDKSNKVTEINSSSTDTQYPSAKCVYDSQEKQNEHIAELEMLYNAFPTVSDEDTTIQLDNTAKVKFREIDLKGNTSQVVIPEEQGTSVSNTSIYVSDVNTDKENTIEMSGNTYQKTTTGKNLFNKYGDFTYGNTNYKTSLNVQGQIVSTSNFYNNRSAGILINVNQNTDYTISGKIVSADGTGGNNVLIQILNTSGQSIQLEKWASTITKPFDFNFTFNSGGNSQIWVSFNGSNSGTAGNTNTIFDNIQMEQGTTATTYEPFTNGASPNPSYPQNIEVVTGQNDIAISGKNLFNPTYEVETQYTTNGNVSTNYYTLNNSAISIARSNAQWGRYFFNKLYLKSGTYTLSFTPTLSGSDKRINYSVRNLDTQTDLVVNQKMGITDGTRTNISFTLNNDQTVSFSLQPTVNDSGTLELTNVQLEKSSTATTYEPYAKNIYPINLGNIELCKIDNYQDRIYKKNDKWYLEKQIGKVVLDENSGIGGGTDLGSVYRFTLTGLNQFLFTNTTNTAYCNILSTIDTRFNADVESYYLAEGVLVFKINKSVIDSKTGTTIIEKCNNYLSNQNLLFVCRLTTPSTTEITDSTLVSQLNALYNATIYPITNINTDTSNLLPYIDLQYNVVTPSPSPNRPSQVNVVKGDNVITISNSDNTESQAFPINLGDIELCKIGTYQDYIYESNGNWFKKGNIGKVVLNGSENWQIELYTYYLTNFNAKPYSAFSPTTPYAHSNYFKWGNGSSGSFIEGSFWYTLDGSKLRVEKDNQLDLNAFKTWLSTHNTIVYYALGTPTDTQITDTTLITQLNNIKKAYSYDTQTNISQTNTDKPFIIYAEAIRSLKDVFE